ncbi:putative damage-inducible protein DinB [Saccharopolyspora lacisalsi]|uniref:Putative damage-inducible protein DinB n=1 Tax=Halosaccharopolyspora lacisalsi TaxID=1000566 RepID=A0A839DLL2_9PSEU|nr:DinB family protein [Halosaccharopolyspora lacisalsi]MBA8822842.1 putative damage-inducible protein DinB [Halosaccharopolyspora lacisalsi]
MDVTSGTSPDAFGELGEFGEPPATTRDSRELLVGYLDWYRDRLLHKVAGLTDVQLRTPVPPMGWAPLGLVRHLGMVERRWLRWGFAAEDVLARLPGGDEAEWDATSEPTAAILAAYRDEVERSRTLIARAELDDPARTGGRFRDPEQVPSLRRIVFHLFQEYARHVGQLDVARELVDGATGE